MSTGPLSQRRQGNGLDRRAEDEVHHADDEKGYPDGQQQLRERVRLPVDAAIKQKLERDRDDDCPGDRDEDGDEIGSAEREQRIGREIAADHGESAMSEIHHPHQPHHDR